MQLDISCSTRSPVMHIYMQYQGRSACLLPMIEKLKKEVMKCSCLLWQHLCLRVCLRIHCFHCLVTCVTVNRSVDLVWSTLQFAVMQVAEQPTPSHSPSPLKFTGKINTMLWSSNHLPRVQDNKLNPSIRKYRHRPVSLQEYMTLPPYNCWPHRLWNFFSSWLQRGEKKTSIPYVII